MDSRRLPAGMQPAMNDPAMAAFAMLFLFVMAAVMGGNDGRAVVARMDLRTLCLEYNLAFSRKGA